MTRKWITWTAVAAGVVLLGGVVMQQRTLAKAGPEAEPKSVGPAENIRYVVAAGRVEPASEEITIGSELDGKLQSVPVEEGDTVRRGQVVGVLDNGHFAARIEIAKSDVREREAALERLRNGERVEVKREAAAAVREAEAAVEQARAERERREMLLRRGAISKAEFEVGDRDFRTAEARLDAVRERKNVADQQTRPEDIRRAEAELDRAKANVSEAEAMYAKTLLRSPVNGRVLRKYRKAGESVSANGSTPVLALGDLSTLRVRVDVDETDVARLHVGQKAYVTAEAYGEKHFTGQVVRIGQALGRKNVRTDEPSERVDKKILETLVELDKGQNLPVGLRVDAYLEDAQVRPEVR
ncbi:MAG: HlyD family efflux transporter periplasmic adaptor subunit [Bryobacteraceae bacterium]